MQLNPVPVAPCPHGTARGRLCPRVSVHMSLVHVDGKGVKILSYVKIRVVVDDV